MAVNDVVYVNECGLPLNAIEWLETHHRCKMTERECMIRDLNLKRGDLVVDAGCGPGLWTPLLAQSLGPRGRIIGVDISPDALVTAQRRSAGAWYRRQVQYKHATLEQLPVTSGSVDAIFSANVSQYLPNPVETFAALGRYLTSGGRLAIKDIDFGTMRFHNVDANLQNHVFRARAYWEQQRTHYGYTFEDSWVGSKLAGYLRAAGYEDVQEKTYRIVRSSPLCQDFRVYVQGITEWFVCEGAPFLAHEHATQWLQSFSNDDNAAIGQADFVYEETEYLVTGVWNGAPARRYFDLYRESVSASAEILLAP